MAAQARTWQNGMAYHPAATRPSCAQPEPELPKQKSDGEGSVLRSAERLLTVLGWFSEGSTHGSVAEVARDLEGAPSTVRRLLMLLEKYDYVQRDASGDFHLGFMPLLLADRARDGNLLVRAAQDELDRLQEITGEAVQLGVLEGHHVVHID